MLLSLYLGTTAFSAGYMMLMLQNFDKRFKSEGYTYQDKSTIETIVGVLGYAAILALPVVNVTAATVSYLHNDKCYDKLKRKGIEFGVIKKDDAISKMNKEYNYNAKDNNFKPYANMSVEEKLEFLQKEREMLLNEKNSQEIERNKVYLKK